MMDACSSMDHGQDISAATDDMRKYQHGRIGSEGPWSGENFVERMKEYSMTFCGEH